jgi:hypothetical protein
MAVPVEDDFPSLSLLWLRHYEERLPESVVKRRREPVRSSS